MRLRRSAGRWRGDSRRRSTGQLAMNQATRPPIECLAVDAPDEREPVAEFAALRSTHGGSSNHSVEGPHNNNHCERSDKPITHCYFLWRRNQASAEGAHTTTKRRTVSIALNSPARCGVSHAAPRSICSSSVRLTIPGSAFLAVAFSASRSASTTAIAASSVRNRMGTRADMRGRDERRGLRGAIHSTPELYKPRVSGHSCHDVQPTRA